ncbi:MAG: isoprenylcysteine carboxylmethyltransferase family protein [Desulfobulbus sp.]|jgi:protein-S-isoprenylcysteine O-methyltransferase Ste14|uniref:methyltransferase family protein n=1 Tax=Desulfobulbus sp. TaxID=895 RepID=UPI00284F69A8|nr:isoprenylcysteine carboxylmethyltransferase family protein [Desulfobulbus sp.]MDR2549910.1 isoprenylcysteine carboxylmethyltransferase family protein [Desulfobulbus sp.]
MRQIRKYWPTNENSLEWAIRWRHPVSLAVILACVALQFTTPPSWPKGGLADNLSDLVGFPLVVLAAFGRIWCSIYISGYKEDRIVAEGPYAIVRNPLYVFSCLGVIGLGLTTNHLLILTIVTGAFFLYYPLVVLAEERNLQRKFGNAYEEYRLQVPRFIPNEFRLVEPDPYLVRPRHLRRSLQEIVCFFWAYLSIHLLVHLQ